MLSATYISTVFTDAGAIAREILSGLAGNEPSTPAVGFLFCDSQTDYAAVLEIITAQAAFPVVGGTALGFPFAGGDGAEISAALMLMAKEGLEAAVAVSAPLTEESHTEQMGAVFAACREALGEAPKLVMPFFPLMPGFPTGLFIDEVITLAKDAPVFGGTTTNDLISTRPAVFAQGTAFTDRMVLVMLGGDIKPVFATGNKVSPTVEYAPTVTLSEDNTVYRVDDDSYCDYMRAIGISPEDRINGVDALMQYGPTPVIVHTPGTPESDVPEVRCISCTDVGKGCAMFSGPVPEGARLRMSILRKQDVEDSAAECLAKLRRRMAAEEAGGYAYTTLFCISCVARYFVFTGDRNTERELLMRERPQGLSPIGFYAFCEIGPAYAAAGNTLMNRSHSASIALCAI